MAEIIVAYKAERFVAASRVLLLLLTLAIWSGCVVYEPIPYPSSPFDTAWNSALGAAHDVGVRVSSADRDRGTIIGQRGPADVTINVLTQHDGRIRVEIKVRAPEPEATRLSEDFYQAYERYRGR